MTTSIYDLADLFNLEPSERLFFEAFPINAEECIIRFANQEDGTCIYHKFTDYKMIQGGIILWHGTKANIPAEYALCDGDNGTPDLRDKFVVGAPDGDDPGGVGGAVNHNHNFTTDGHFHDVLTGVQIEGGGDWIRRTTTETDTGTTDNEDGRPPFYEIAYIMKL